MEFSLLRMVLGIVQKRVAEVQFVPIKMVLKDGSFCLGWLDKRLVHIRVDQ